MRVLLELEAPPDPWNCISCGTDGLYRCTDCLHQPMFCRECCRMTHQRLLFHRVQHWNGEFFEESALHMVRDALITSHCIYRADSDWRSAAARAHQSSLPFRSIQCEWHWRASQNECP
ncbi:hypothetical protein BKA82DRAFT_3987505 [Pisolithus tinctorius]|nr:hypothetical protein BKA82DRAFT_3987505 [Pisolithus tinctorius]